MQNKVPARGFRESRPTAGYRGRGYSSGNGEKKFLLRLASTTERLQIRDKVRDESDALAVITEKVHSRGLVRAYMYMQVCLCLLPSSLKLTPSPLARRPSQPQPPLALCNTHGPPVCSLHFYRHHSPRPWYAALK